MSTATHYGGRASPGESRGLESSVPNKHLTNEHRMIWITNLKNWKQLKAALAARSPDVYVLQYAERPQAASLPSLAEDIDSALFVSLRMDWAVYASRAGFQTAMHPTTFRFPHEWPPVVARRAVSLWQSE